MNEAAHGGHAAWVKRRGPLAAELDALPPQAADTPRRRAHVYAKLGDLALALDLPAEAAAEYEAGLAGLGVVPQLPPLAWRAARRFAPGLAVPVAYPGPLPTEALVERLSAGLAFAWLAQGQLAPARVLAVPLTGAAGPLTPLLRGALAWAGDDDDDQRAAALHAAAAALLATRTEGTGLDHRAYAATLRALAALAADPTWKAWAAVAAEEPAARAAARAHAVLLAAWADHAATALPGLADDATARARGAQLRHEEAVASAVHGRSLLAGGRTLAARRALEGALRLHGARAGGLPDDTARVALVGAAGAARDPLLDVTLAIGDARRAAIVAEDARGLALELDIPGDDGLSTAFLPHRLVFQVRDDETLVLSVGARPDDVVAHRALIGRDALTAAVDALHAALGVDGRRIGPAVELHVGPEKSAADHLSELYALLVGPVAARLPAHATVVIEPDGPLWRLPFAALLTPDGSPFGARGPLVHGPSAAVVTRLRARGDSPYAGSAFLVGNPTMPPLPGGTPRPLEGAAAEVDWLAKRMGGAPVLGGDEATVPAVLAGMRGVRLIHLGTHALALPDAPADGFLVLAPGDPARDAYADGRLDSWRLYAGPDADPAATDAGGHAIRAGQEWIDADLVVLSACQTAAGQATADGVIGLARTFLAIGARTVVASLWSVDDDATGALMRAFYSRWLRGESAAHALAGAAAVARKRHGADAPALWAPFIVLGAGEPGTDGPVTERGDMAEMAPPPEDERPMAKAD